MTTDQQIWCSTGDVTGETGEKKVLCAQVTTSLYVMSTQYSSTETAWYLVLWISLRFEHSVGACMGSLWFVRAIDLY